MGHHRVGRPSNLLRWIRVLVKIAIHASNPRGMIGTNDEQQALDRLPSRLVRGQGRSGERDSHVLNKAPNPYVFTARNHLVAMLLPVAVRRSRVASESSSSHQGAVTFGVEQGVARLCNANGPRAVLGFGKCEC